MGRSDDIFRDQWQQSTASSLLIALVAVGCCCFHMKASIIKSVVTGQDAVSLEWNITPGGKIKQTNSSGVHVFQVYHS